MGFVAIDPYLKPAIGTLGPLVMTALATAADRLGGPHADDAVKRWFGTKDAAFKATLARDLRRMRSVINVHTITIGSEDLMKRHANTNASAWTAPGRVGVGDKVLDDEGRSVFVDANFHKLSQFLPKSGTRINANGDYQSQFNTLVHELSHLLIGTKDVAGARGTAYGTKNAEALAAATPLDAAKNAENWGIFVEACGHHRTS